MDYSVFSWQKNDFENLLDAYLQRIIFINSKDISSSYNVFTSFNKYLYDNGHSIFLVSNNNPSLNNPLLPFLSAIDRTVSKRSIISGVRKALIKDITSSDTIAQIYENIMEPRKTQSLYLSERENEILLQYDRIADGNIPIFVFSGYSNFDSTSRRLTELMVCGQVDRDYPFLSKSKYIFLRDTKDDFTAYKDIAICEHIDLTLSEPIAENMDEILAEISPTLRLKGEEMDKLFHLAGGRLSVIELLSRYLTDNSIAQLNCADKDAIDSALNDRLERLEQKGHDVKRVLETAAVIGSSFKIDLLKKAFTKPEPCEKILKISEEEFLTVCNGDMGEFKYTEIWTYFLHFLSPDNLASISNAVAEAIYFFNPYDYFNRAYYLEQAGKFSEAWELYILAYNNFYQEGISPSNELVEKLNCLSEDYEKEIIWTDLKECYELMKNLEFKKCMDVLDDMPILLTPRIRLLTEYLKGICIHRAGDTIEYQKSALLFIEKAAEHAYSIEDGIWCDCQMVLISFCVNMSGDITRAKNISKELEYYYTEKSYAPFAAKGLHALERKHSSLYSVEKAIKKTERSVKYFRESIYPSQYLMALNNHSANLMVLGHFSESRDYLMEALTFLAKNKRTTVNQKYILNNHLLCSVLSGETTPNYAHEKMSEWLKDKDYGDWQVILKLNNAIYLALDSCLDEAEKSLMELKELSEALEDNYYLYYTHANLASVYYLQGQADKAVSLLNTYCLHPPTLYKETEKHYLRERTKEWVHAMNNELISDPSVFDTFLLNKHPEGTQWAFLGRGFLYSDIQFWSEP